MSDYNTANAAPMIPHTLDDALYASLASSERIASLLAYIYADLVGGDDGQQEVGPGYPISVVDKARLLSQRLDFISERLPQLRAIIRSPDVATLGQGAVQSADLSIGRSAGRTRGGFQ